MKLPKVSVSICPQAVERPIVIVTVGDRRGEEKER